MGSDGRLPRPAVPSRISIHAPRMGSDDMMQCIIQPNGDFNPRSPDGERPQWSFGRRLQVLFQSTLPGWGATSRHVEIRTVSTHFNPRSPDGERPTIPITATALYTFQSTLPGWGATMWCGLSRVSHGVISIHAPRMGSDFSLFRTLG